MYSPARRSGCCLCNSWQGGRHHDHDRQWQRSAPPAGCRRSARNSVPRRYGLGALALVAAAVNLALTSEPAKDKDARLSAERKAMEERLGRPVSDVGFALRGMPEEMLRGMGLGFIADAIGMKDHVRAREIVAADAAAAGPRAEVRQRACTGRCRPATGAAAHSPRLLLLPVGPQPAPLAAAAPVSAVPPSPVVQIAAGPVVPAPAPAPVAAAGAVTPCGAYYARRLPERRESARSAARRRRQSSNRQHAPELLSRRRWQRAPR